jgi:hypothetical protein
MFTHMGKTKAFAYLSRDQSQLEMPDIHFTISSNKPETLSILLNWGAPRGIRNKEGQTALYFAFLMEKPRCMDVLFSHRVDATSFWQLLTEKEADISDIALWILQDGGRLLPSLITDGTDDIKAFKTRIGADLPTFVNKLSQHATESVSGSNPHSLTNQDCYQALTTFKTLFVDPYPNIDSKSKTVLNQHILMADSLVRLALRAVIFLLQKSESSQTTSSPTSITPSKRASRWKILQAISNFAKSISKPEKNKGNHEG